MVGRILSLLKLNSGIRNKHLLGHKEKPWALYMRVSGKKQERDGTYGSQEMAFDRFEKQIGKRCVWYIDLAVSGGNMWGETRIDTNFNTLMDDVRKDRLAGVVVANFDRFGSNQEELIKNIKVVCDHCEFKSLDRYIPDRHKQPIGFCSIVGSSAMMAEVSKLEFLKNMANGKERRIIKDGHSPFNPPFGYVYDHEERKVVKDVKVMCEIDGRGLSNADIVNMIVDLSLGGKVPSEILRDPIISNYKYERKSWYRKDGVKKTIVRVTREIIQGILSKKLAYRDIIRWKRKVRGKEKVEFHEGNHEPYLTLSQAKKIDEIRAARAPQVNVNRKEMVGTTDE